VPVSRVRMNAALVRRQVASRPVGDHPEDGEKDPDIISVRCCAAPGIHARPSDMVEEVLLIYGTEFVPRRASNL
jgi:hypothetical protein